MKAVFYPQLAMSQHIPLRHMGCTGINVITSKDGSTFTVELEDVPFLNAQGPGIKNRCCDGRVR